MIRLRWHVGVADVGGEVNREANAHDEVDHWYWVQIDVPQWHVARNAQLNGDDTERHPQWAQEVRDENERDNHHYNRSDDHALDWCRPDQLKLIEEHEVRMEDGRIDWGILTNLPQILHHNFLMICIRDIDGLDEEARCDDSIAFLIKFNIQREWISWK